MSINLNNPDEFTLANVRQLIASGNAKRAIQLRVSLRGSVDFVPANEAAETNDFAFKFTPWLPRDHRVGPEAARDDQWVLRVYQALRENWPFPASKFIAISD